MCNLFISPEVDEIHFKNNTLKSSQDYAYFGDRQCTHYWEKHISFFSCSRQDSHVQSSLDRVRRKLPQDWKIPGYLRQGHTWVGILRLNALNCATFFLLIPRLFQDRPKNGYTFSCDYCLRKHYQMSNFQSGDVGSTTCFSMYHTFKCIKNHQKSQRMLPVY